MKTDYHYILFSTVYGSSYVSKIYGREKLFQIKRHFSKTIQFVNFLSLKVQENGSMTKGLINEDSSSNWIWRYCAVLASVRFIQGAYSQLNKNYSCYA